MNSLSQSEIDLYQNQGYIIKKSFFSEEEIDKLYEVALADDAIQKNSFDLNDQNGKKTKLALWFTPCDDIYGYLTQSERMVKSVKTLLKGDAPICHYHNIRSHDNNRVLEINFTT